MTSPEDRMGRREFIVNYLSPLLTAFGVAFGVGGVIKSNSAENDARADVIHARQSFREALQARCQSVKDASARLACQESDKEIEPYWVSLQGEKWAWYGGNIGSIASKYALVTGGLGLMIKLVDIVSQKRSQAQVKQP